LGRDCRKRKQAIARLSPGWRPVALAVLAALPALTAVRGEFLWTESVEIMQEGLIRPLGGPLWEAITAGIDGHYYRPTVFLLHAVDARLFGLSSLAFRLTNYGFHVLNVVLLYALASRLLEDSRQALAAAALFAMHPVAVTTVALCSDRTDAVALTASFGVVLGAWVFRRGGRVWMLPAVWTLLLFGLGAKETAAGSILVVAAMAFRARGVERRRLVLLVVGAAVLSGAWFAWRNSVTTNPVGVERADLSLAERVGLAGRIHFEYLFNAVLGMGLRVCDDALVPTPPWGWAVMALVLLSGSIAALARMWRRTETVLCLVWVVAFLIPTSGLLSLKHVRADRYLYPVLPGVLMLLSTLAARLRPKAMLATVSAVYVAYAASFITRTRLFRSDQALWTHEVERSDSCLEGHSYLAASSYRAGDIPDALRHATKALTGHPRVLAFVDRAGAMQQLALARFESGDEAGAGALWLELAASGRERQRAEAEYHLGLREITRRRYAGAARHFEAAGMSGLLSPDAARDNTLLWAYALAHAGQVDRARRLLAELRPDENPRTEARARLLAELTALVERGQ
jgi:hypothetical protein